MAEPVVTVPDEAVEAGAEALRSHEWNNPPDFPSIGWLSAHGNHTYDAWCAICRGEVAEIVPVVLAAAAPLIVEHYLRSRIRSAEVETAPEEVWEQVRQVARNAAVRTAVVDALRSAAGKIRAELVCCNAYDLAHGDGPLIARVEYGGHGICFWGEAAARINEARAVELERGTDR